MQDSFFLLLQRCLAPVVSPPVPHARTARLGPLLAAGLLLLLRRCMHATPAPRPLPVCPLLQTYAQQHLRPSSPQSLRPRTNPTLPCPAGDDTQRQLQMVSWLIKPSKIFRIFLTSLAPGQRQISVLMRWGSRSRCAVLLVAFTPRTCVLVRVGTQAARRAEGSSGQAGPLVASRCHLPYAALLRQSWLLVLLLDKLGGASGVRRQAQGSPGGNWLWRFMHLHNTVNPSCIK